MARVLILDTSTDSSEHIHIRGALGPGDDVDVRLLNERQSVPAPRGYDLAIHTGSAFSIVEDAPFQAALFGFIRAASSAGLPQFGICYGHQALCRALVGDPAVRRVPGGVEAGWCEVRITPTGRVLLGTEARIAVFQFHFDEVVALPPGARRIAWNGHTRVQGFLDRARRLVGVQFHPEFDEGSGNRVFREAADLLERNGLSADRVTVGGPSGFHMRRMLEATMGLAG
ncbi:MAG: type 1 glutamine amidotransferase [Deltaproteobacteria bacterium]|nr:type 1 glutamine amidotransferase [Deltaproteobacteria bacterium]